MNFIIDFINKRKKPVNPVWIVITVSSISALGWLFQNTDPNNSINIYIFFIVISTLVYSILFSMTYHVRHAVLITLGVCGVLLLRLLLLRDAYYIVLLSGCLISLELYFQKQ